MTNSPFLRITVLNKYPNNKGEFAVDLEIKTIRRSFDGKIFYCLTPVQMHDLIYNLELGGIVAYEPSKSDIIKDIHPEERKNKHF